MSIYLDLDASSDPPTPATPADGSHVWRVFFNHPLRGWCPVLAVARTEQEALVAARARYAPEFDGSRATLVQKIERG